jgi:hypothetical protein
MPFITSEALRNKFVANLKKALPVGTKITMMHLVVKTGVIVPKKKFKGVIAVAGELEGGGTYTMTGKAGHAVAHTEASGGTLHLETDTTSYDEEHYSTWHNNLSSQESTAISSWKGGSQKSIKVAISDYNDGKTEELDSTARAFLRAMKKMPVFTGIAYRGMSGSHADKLIKQFLDNGVGGDYIESCPAGYGRSANYPITRAGGKILLRTHFKHGARMFENIHGYEHETEMAIPPKSKMIVTALHQNVKVKGSGGNSGEVQLVVDLEQVTPGDLSYKKHTS